MLACLAGQEDAAAEAAIVGQRSIHDEAEILVGERLETEHPQA